MRYKIIPSVFILSSILSGCGGDEPRDASRADPAAPSTSSEAVPADDLQAAATPALVPDGVSSLRLYTLDCGTIAISDLDGFSTSGDYAGVSDVFTDTCYLIRHPDGDLLWDVGLPAAIKAPEPTVNDVFTLTMEKTLAEQLTDIGVEGNDIEYLSISHSHFDHAGQPEAAPEATWLVHANEYEAMFGTPEAAAQYPGFATLAREEFTGDRDVFGDGSVVILELPGHTPGHTALQVTLPEAGPVLLTGDLYHRAESRELKRVPRFNSDEAQTRVSMDRFESLVTELGARVIIQHEPADVDTLPKAPDYLQ